MARRRAASVRSAWDCVFSCCSDTRSSLAAIVVICASNRVCCASARACDAACCSSRNSIARSRSIGSPILLSDLIVAVAGLLQRVDEGAEGVLRQGCFRRQLRQLLTEHLIRFLPANSLT